MSDQFNPIKMMVEAKARLRAAMKLMYLDKSDQACAQALQEMALARDAFLSNVLQLPQNAKLRAAMADLMAPFYAKEP